MSTQDFKILPKSIAQYMNEANRSKPSPKPKRKPKAKESTGKDVAAADTEKPSEEYNIVEDRSTEEINPFLT